MSTNEARTFDDLGPDPYEYDHELDYDPMDDCHMGPDGYCGAAGSEHCDFECPIMRSRRAARAKGGAS